MFSRFRRSLAAASSLAALIVAVPALAQNAAPLPELKVEARRAAPAPRTRTIAAPRRPTTARAIRPAAPVQRPVASAPTTPAPSALTTPNLQAAQVQAARIPGAVSVVADTTFKERQANTIKDVLDYVPGVFAQPKWGDDTRLSIRGSGLSRNFHLRGIQLYLDGIPINTADGYGDFHEIDPSAYRLVQVFKGGNALALGSNTYGGAINFVTPSGYDAPRAQASLAAGSFGFHREQASSGGVHGPWDYFITVSNQQIDGYREHSQGRALRGSANIGYRFSDNAETHFYINGNHVRQRIPGEVNEFDAITKPRTARLANVTNDQQRNIDTFRIGNKTTLKFDATTVEFGAFYLNRHLMHPIFQWLDYTYNDYGAFAKLTDDRKIGAYRNRFTAGVTLHNGTTQAKQYANLTGAAKGALLSLSRQTSKNTSLFAENAFYLRPDLSLVLGMQSLLASREQRGSLATPTFSKDFVTFNPKVGLVYDLKPNWQLFANVSRATEAPSFSETLAGSLIGIRPQKSLSVEIGTRGREENVQWDIAAYRANLRDEFQCIGAVGSCTPTNVPKTIHQGIEAGFGAAIWKGIVAAEDKLWLNAAYTLNDFRFDGNPTYGNNVLPGVPRHVLKAELVYRHTSGFYVGPNVEWAPESFYQDNANTKRGNPYALLGLRAGYESGKMWSAFIEGKNLTDKRYVSSASISTTYNPAGAAGQVFNPGNGLSVVGGINMKW
ncbi:MAG: TonB-dependent receptor [Proteobacteria bacterium]|nr:TonB-dependent receptor [Pseudomonadota bacterium]